MDVATFIGLIVGFGLIAYAIVQKGGGADSFWQLESLMLVLGGTIAATLVNYPLKNVWRVFNVVKNAFKRSRYGYLDLIETFSTFADKVRKKGILSLQDDLDTVEDKFMRDGIELAVNEKDQERLRNYLKLELSNIDKRHTVGQEIFFYMGNYAPAFGMVGTVVGLIIMLNHFSVTGSESTGIEAMIGSFEFDIASKFKELLGGMALALLTTFYGLILANLVFTPLGGKLKRRSDEEIMLKEFMIEGILCLHNRDHPLVVREKLNTFVPRTELDKSLNHK